MKHCLLQNHLMLLLAEYTKEGLSVVPFKQSSLRQRYHQRTNKEQNTDDTSQHSK